MDPPEIGLTPLRRASDRDSRPLRYFPYIIALVFIVLNFAFLTFLFSLANLKDPTMAALVGATVNSLSNLLSIVLYAIFQSKVAVPTTKEK